SLQCAMRGKQMSSAKRVCPVTLARPSTRRRGTPMTRNPSPGEPEPATGELDFSFCSDIYPLEGTPLGVPLDLQKRKKKPIKDRAARLRACPPEDRCRSKTKNPARRSRVPARLAKGFASLACPGAEWTAAPR